MKTTVEISRIQMMPCKWCGRPSGPGPACRACGSPLHTRLPGQRAFSEDRLALQRLLLAARVEASRRRELEAPRPSKAWEPDRAPVATLAGGLIVATASGGPLEVPSDSRPEASAGSGTLLALESGWWGASPAPDVRAALRIETAWAVVTRVAAFLGSVWLLDFLVNHV